MLSFIDIIDIEANIWYTNANVITIIRSEKWEDKQEKQKKN